MKLNSHKKCTKCQKEYLLNKEYFYHRNRIKNTYSSRCKKCDNEYIKKLDKKNPEKRKIRQIKYRQTEEGHFKELYSSMKKHCRRDRKELGIKSPKELILCWEEQKKISGWYCPVTKDEKGLPVEMTMIKGLGNNKQCPTNISPDRLDNDKGYTKENIWFVTASFNTRKGAMKIKEMKETIAFNNKRKLPI